MTMACAVAWLAVVWRPAMAAEAVVLPPAPPIMVELITPPSDELGHYLPLDTSGSYPLMGAVASASPITAVTVGVAPAVLYPLKYRVFQAPDGYIVTGFRAWVFLEPNLPLRITVLDQAGNLQDASFLPDGDAAMSRFNFWRQRTSEDPFVALRASVGHAIQGDDNLALPTLDLLVSLHPEYPVIRHLRALTRWDAGDWDGALADLQAVVAAAPDAYAPQVDLARLLHSMGNYPDAIAQYQAALNLVPAAAEVHYLLGQALREQNNLDTASLQEQAALQAYPDFPNANYELGVILAQQGNTDQALYRFQRAAQVNPQSGDVVMALARMYYTRGDYPRAWRMVQRAERWGTAPPKSLTDALTQKMKEPHSYTPAAAF